MNESRVEQLIKNLCGDEAIKVVEINGCHYWNIEEKLKDRVLHQLIMYLIENQQLIIKGEEKND